MGSIQRANPVPLEALGLSELVRRWRDQEAHRNAREGVVQWSHRGHIEPRERIGEI